MTDIASIAEGAIMPVRVGFGVSEIWREDGTGTRDLYIFGVRVWRSHFAHSTWLDH